MGDSPDSSRYLVFGKCRVISCKQIYNTRYLRKENMLCFTNLEHPKNSGYTVGFLFLGHLSNPKMVCCQGTPTGPMEMTMFLAGNLKLAANMPAWRLKKLEGRMLILMAMETDLRKDFFSYHEDIF